MQFHLTRLYDLIRLYNMYVQNVKLVRIQINKIHQLACMVTIHCLIRKIIHLFLKRIVKRRYIACLCTLIDIPLDLRPNTQKKGGLA